MMQSNTTALQTTAVTAKKMSFYFIKSHFYCRGFALDLLRKDTRFPCGCSVYNITLLSSATLKATVLVAGQMINLYKNILGKDKNIVDYMNCRAKGQRNT